MNELYEGRAALLTLLLTGAEACPDHIRDHALSIKDGDLSREIELARLIYDADRGDGDSETVGPAVMQIGAAMFGVIATRGFYNGLDGDAAKMRQALLRDAGVEAPAGMTWIDPADDPAKRGATAEGPSPE